jgi:pSer/pThr/pTyr-binding forkhead associated (FHA) protein
MAKLVVRFKDAVLREVLLDKPVISIGRSKRNDITLENLAVSRRHARVYREGPRYIVQDLKSLNGTYVNKKIAQWILSHKEEIHIGEHSLVFIDNNKRQTSAVESGPSVDTDKRPFHESGKQSGSPGHRQKAITGEEKAGVRARITIISGGSGQQDIELAKRLTIAGKGEHADIRLKGLLVERTVFLISKGSSGFTISTIGGKTITQLNGVPVTDQAELKDGDIISAGWTRMQFHVNTDLSESVS